MSRHETEGETRVAPLTSNQRLNNARAQSNLMASPSDLASSATSPVHTEPREGTEQVPEGESRTGTNQLARVPLAIL